ncbi:acyltransferase [Bradyrhizobium tropiciagri]|uniref:acyltransferase family protein n=1 Tax=Bradyrhizobium tropiciagri TaxID=312253 RepID=UPI001BA9F76D|nr:acyltransferase family protein [Bradyrhizobium tropiciagri]MBR0874545.1 acyltransferase [Bradyrhizobium tropiciagri]
MKYRADVDGLRALAVSSVVLFHANIGGLGGGFLGVDIFFVISGFLITNLIAGEIEAGCFSLAAFYERRIRRILPAAAVMFAVSAALAWWMLLPEAFTLFSKSLLAAVFFSSNWYFLNDVGYFAAPAASKPLLHTWTLSIEEQFYLFYPFLLLILTTAARRFIVLAVLCMASIAYARWLGDHVSLDSAFYNSASRAFEPLIGCLTALAYRRFTAGPMLSIALRFVGLGLIGFALLSDGAINWLGGSGDGLIGTGVPSFQRLLVPCVGAAMMLFARPVRVDPVYRIMSSPPLRVVGVLSYSIYLWHWPALVFGRIYWAGGLDGTQTAIILTATVLLSVITYYAIERPARFSRRLRGRQALIFAMGSVSTAAIALFAATIIKADGAPWRLSPQVMTITASTWDDRLLRCLVPPGGQPESIAMAESNSLCRIGDESRKTDDFILWGDSHAAAFAHALSGWASRAGLRGILAVMQGCPSLSHTATREQGRTQKCSEFYQSVFKLIVRNDIRYVIMVDRWSMYTDGEPSLKTSGYLRFADDWEHPTDAHSVFVTSLDRTLRELQGRKVYVLEDPPLQPIPVTDALATNALMGFEAGRLDRLWTSRAKHLDSRTFVDRSLIAAETKFADVHVLDPTPLLCPGDRCPAVRDGLPIYHDDDHLNRRGVLLLKPLFDPVVQEMASRRRR